MLKPLFNTILLALIAVSTLSAREKSCCAQPSIEFKTGYFFFTDSKMRKVYDKGGIDLQLSANYPIWNLNSQWTLNAYGAVEYFNLYGKSIHDHQKTTLWAVPVNFGLKPIYSITPTLQYYFAIGPRYFYVHQHNHSSFVYQNKSRSGIGFFINTGFNFLICDNLILDLFAEYSYAKTRFHGSSPRVFTRHIQIGGITLGLGLGSEF